MKCELETNRLRLLPCRIEDIEAAHNLWTNYHIRQYLFDDQVISLEEARSFVEASLVNFQQRGYGLWLVFTRKDRSLHALVAGRPLLYYEKSRSVAFSAGLSGAH